MGNSNLEVKQKQFINQMIGLIIIVYIIFSLITGHVGAYLYSPFSFLFGGITVAIFAILLTLGVYLIIVKSWIPRLKIYQYILLSIALIFLCVMLSFNENILFSNVFKNYFNIYSPQASVFNADNSIFTLGGGLIGYLFLGILNSLTKDISLTILITILVFVLSLILFLLPYIIKLIKKISKNENRNIEKRKEEKPIYRPTRNNTVGDDGLTRTTSINITGENYNLTREINLNENSKLKELLEIYDDEIYDDYYKGNTKEKNNFKENGPVLSQVAVENEINQKIVKSVEDVKETTTPDVEIKEDEVIFEKPIENGIAIEKEVEEIKQEVVKEKPQEESKTTFIKQEYRLPPLFLLKDAIDNGANYENEEYAKRQAHVLLEKMHELNVNASINAFVVGPSVTRFEISLAPGVRVGSFINLQEDFKLALGVNSIRIESPIPGKSAIGIEVPNKARAMVSLKEIITKMPDKKEKLYVPVGKDITGNPLSFPICNMPHCLISGATNSGKSVCANSIILSLIMNYTPDEVKFIMVDPKRVEMTMYTNLPHLLCPIITEGEKARVALDRLCQEMDSRFQRFAENGVKNIAGYNTMMQDMHKDKMPFIILVVDEFAELMLCKNHSQVEEKIQKLAQLGRAAGIHLILATQRPDVNVIPGTIKTNLPCRMTFRLSSVVDSRTVIDVGGAEKLLNNGDMLLLTPDFSGLRRVQGTFVSDGEIEEIVNYCKSQRAPSYDENFLDLRSKEEIEEEEKLKYALDNKEDDGENDEVYMEAKRLVVMEQKASTSFLQVRMKIGYARAARYIDMLEQDGIIGPANGSKPRDVLISSIDNLD